MSFDKCTQPCSRHHNQGIEQTPHSPKVPLRTFAINVSKWALRRFYRLRGKSLGTAPETVTATETSEESWINGSSLVTLRSQGREIADLLQKRLEHVKLPGKKRQHTYTSGSAPKLGW